MRTGACLPTGGGGGRRRGIVTDGCGHFVAVL